MAKKKEEQVKATETEEMKEKLSFPECQNRRLRIYK